MGGKIGRYLMTNKILGGLLVVVAIIVLTGQFIPMGGDWWEVDYLTIAVCGVSGAMLLMRGSD